MILFRPFSLFTLFFSWFFTSIEPDMYVVNKMRGNLQIEASSSWVSVVVEGCSGVDDEIGTHDEWYMGKKAHYIIL